MSERTYATIVATAVVKKTDKEITTSIILLSKEKALERISKKYPNIEIISMVESEVNLIPTSVRVRHGSGIWHTTRDLEYAKSTKRIKTVQQLLELPVAQYKYGSSSGTSYACRLRLGIDNRILEFFPVQDLDPATTVASEDCRWAGKIETIVKFESLDSTGKMVERKFYELHFNRNLSFIIESSEEAITGKIAQFAEMFSKPKETSNPKTERYSSFLCGQELAVIDSDIARKHWVENIRATMNNLEINISKFIQYNHIEKKFSDSIMLPEILYEIGNMTDDEYRQFSTNVASANTLKYLVKEKSSRLVPKNGELYAGTREMVFRTDLENLLMAVGASKIFQATNIPGNHFGTRIVNNALIPYIYSYNLFRSESIEVGQRFSACIYTDVSKYFENITYDLVEEAALFFAEKGQLSSVKHSLNLIRRAMIGTSRDFLTIDTNFEHAISTIVLAFIIESMNTDINVEIKTFVDDILIFGENLNDLELAYAELERVCDNHNLSLNKSKEKRFTGDNYLEEIKELVFLPTSLRYKNVEENYDSDIADVLTEIKIKGFEAFIAETASPIITANSDLQTFARNFKYHEAQWVVKNFRELEWKYELGTFIEVNDKNILEILQFYTLSQEEFEKTDIQNLLIIMEKYPSKTKWILSILYADLKYGARRVIENLLALHKSDYTRYLAANKDMSQIKSEKRYDKNYFIVSTNETNFGEMMQILTANDYLPAQHYLNYSDFFSMLLSSGRDIDSKLTLFKFFPSKKLFVPFVDDIRKDDVTIPFDLWKWYVKHEKSIFEYDSTMI